MKHVFVETNFLVALLRPFPQKPACDLYSRHRHNIELHIPWCAFTEASRTLERIIREDLAFVDGAGRLLGSMMTSDRVAASVARQVGAGAVFAVGAAGLLGTAAALGAAAGVRVTIDPAEVPVAQGAWELVGMSGRSAGAAAVIEVLGGLKEGERVATDPQAAARVR